MKSSVPATVLGLLASIVYLASDCPPTIAQDVFKAPRCEVVPLPDQQASFRIDGVEKTRWHFGPQHPGPFFFPFTGPSGAALTRMGHPGAPNHDHHRSVWFAHHQVGGFDFWSSQANTQIRQKTWLAYRDGNDEAIMAALCGWYAEGREVMEQEVVAALLPLADEHALEFQVTLRPPQGAESVELGKTNFGFLAVRVAKSLSVHFGGGEITNSEGERGEENIFGKPARWVDYSGPLTVGSPKNRQQVTEGITYFDHPANVRYPTHWHVREDGWLGASFCLQESFTIKADQPLVLRYLLHAHSGRYDVAKAEARHKAFADRPGFVVSKAKVEHQHFTVTRSTR